MFFYFMDFTIQQKVIGLYALMPEEINIREIKRENLHNWFYQRKKQGSPIFENLKFNWDRHYPLSKDIYHINSTLKTVVGLSKDFNDFCRNYFNENMKPFMNKSEINKMRKLRKPINKDLLQKLYTKEGKSSIEISKLINVPPCRILYFVKQS